MSRSYSIWQWSDQPIAGIGQQKGSVFALLFIIGVLYVRYCDNNETFAQLLLASRRELVDPVRSWAAKSQGLVPLCGTQIPAKAGRPPSGYPEKLTMGARTSYAKISQ